MTGKYIKYIKLTLFMKPDTDFLSSLKMYSQQM